MSISPIPADASEVVRAAFAVANDAVSQRLCRLPNTWEVTLDQAFIDTLAGIGGPVVVASGWTVRIETHFLGGGRHWPGPDWELMPYRRWEIADIGVIVMIRNGSELKRTKLALFQPTRLYPNEQSMDEIELSHYWRGFSRLYEDDEIAADASAPRVFTFSDDSEYRMLLVGDEQVARIASFEQHQSPVHYLLYNPAIVPWTQSHPIPASDTTPSSAEVGCRVVPAADVRNVLSTLPAGASPTYGALARGLPPPFLRRPNVAGRRIEDFMVRLITCKEGYRATGRADSTLGYVFNRRGAPIVAAIGITLSSPIDDTTDRRQSPTGSRVRRGPAAARLPRPTA